MSQFRVCPDSGFFFDKSAESLMKANAVAAAVSLLVAGVLALGVILTRWQEIHLLPADVFYQALTGHGINALIFWIIFFEIAVLYFASSTLLRTRLAAPKWAWAGFALMIIGAVMNNVAVYQGNSSVMMTSYAPMQAAPHFYLGLILFAVGALIGCFVFLGTLVIAKEDKTYQGSVPLVTFGALTACIIAVFTIASGAIILIPTYLWSIGYINHIDPAMYRRFGGPWATRRSKSTSPRMCQSGTRSQPLYLVRGRCPKRSAAQRSSSTSPSCSSPARTICWLILA